MRPITTFLFLCFISFSLNAQLVEVPIMGNPVLQSYHNNTNSKLEFRGGGTQMPVNYVPVGASTIACIDTMSTNNDYIATVECLNCSSTSFGDATFNDLCITYDSNNGNDDQVVDEVCVEVCTVDNICTQYTLIFETRTPFELDDNNPFFDDFSYAGPYPDASLWLDKDVFVNNTFANNPPSVGFATFDGLDPTGTPYGGGFGLSDQLTTNFIDLSNISSGSTIYVSFHVQEKGFGFEPLPGDTLVVEARLVDGTWSTIELFEPTSSSTVPADFLPISRELIDPNYFHNGFQLRFKNYSRNQGAIEFWHVDYISISSIQTLNALYDDIAFTQIPSTFLDKYTAMPWNHFENNVADETTANYEVNIANHFTNDNDVQNTKQNITELTTGTEVADFVLLDGSEFNIPGNQAVTFNKTIPSSVFSTLQSNLESNFANASDLTFQTTYAYNVGNEQDGAEGILRNDTVKRLTHFSNYFAYDDGSAEAALVAQNASTRIAVKFHANEPDSLRSVQFHFPRIYNGVENQLFNLQVYVGVLDDDPEFEIIFESPYYVDTDFDSLQGFTNYGLLGFDSMPTPLFIPEGDFYVGWQQVSNTANAIPVGLDKSNIDATQYGYYSTATEWLPILPGGLVDGAIMIRPVLGDVTPYNTPVEEVTTPSEEISLFPNPTSNTLNVRNYGESNVNFQIVDANGKLVKKGILTGTIDTADLLNGMYFLRINDLEKGMITKRFVVVR